MSVTTSHHHGGKVRSHYHFQFGPRWTDTGQRKFSVTWHGRLRTP